jgi:hypothetical protein
MRAKFIGLIFVVFSCFILTACGERITARDLQGLSSHEQKTLVFKRMKTKSTEYLIELYTGKEGHPALEIMGTETVAELAGLALQERHNLTKRQLKDGISGLIHVGDDLDMALFSWGCYDEFLDNGERRLYYDRNVSVGSNFYHAQYVCGSGSYIYSTNGKTVTSYQN